MPHVDDSIIPLPPPGAISWEEFLKRDKPTSQEEKAILDDVRSGRITPKEAAERLRKLSSDTIEEKE